MGSGRRARPPRRAAHPPAYAPRPRPTYRARAQQAKAVFVDQAPLQNRVPGWALGSKGCYDEASLLRLTNTLLTDMAAVADGNAECGWAGAPALAWATECKKGPSRRPLGSEAGRSASCARSVPCVSCGMLAACESRARAAVAQRCSDDALGPFAALPRAGCLSLPIPPATAAKLRSETLRCSGAALAELMRDHTQLDWRALLPRIRLPCLNCAGGKSGVFPLDGLLEVARLVPDCCTVVFDQSNHWLYLEQPPAFNDLVLEFVRRGNADRPKLVHVA
jgi:pimeloyl-ACP methyl ester carboxylesterase